MVSPRLNNGLLLIDSAKAVTLERTFLRDLVGEIGTQPADFDGMDAPALEKARPKLAHMLVLASGLCLGSWGSNTG